MKYVITTDYDGCNIRIAVSARIHSAIEAFDEIEQKHGQELVGNWMVRLDEYAGDRVPDALQLPSAEDDYFDLLCQEIREQNVNNSKTFQEQKVGDISRVLAVCTPLQKERFLLYVRDNWTMEEIADMQGCSKMAVSISIKKVLQKVQKSI